MERGEARLWGFVAGKNFEREIGMRRSHQLLLPKRLLGRKVQAWALASSTL